MSDWIPCKERMPDRTGCYLVTVNYSGVFGSGVVIAKWEEPEDRQISFAPSKRGRWKNIPPRDAIAWMELPEVYKP